jgi:hypothetical protein
LISSHVVLCGVEFGEPIPLQELAALPIVVIAPSLAAPSRALLRWMMCAVSTGVIDDPLDEVRVRFAHI